MHTRQAEDEEPERRWEDGRLWTRAEFIDEHGELHGPKQWHRAGRMTAWCKHGDECPHYDSCAHGHRRDIGRPTRRQQHRVRRTRRSGHVESEEEVEEGSEEDVDDGSEEDE